LACFFFYFLGILDCLVLFLTDTGMPREQAVSFFSQALGLGMVSKIALGLLADRIHHKTAILIDYALLTLSSVVLLALPNDALIWAFVGCFGFAAAARDVVTPLMVTTCFGVRYMAQIYGALMLTLLPGGALGPVFAAAVHDRTGSYELAFATFAALNGAALVALCFLRRER
jgi:MFS family permease